MVIWYRSVRSGVTRLLVGVGVGVGVSMFTNVDGVCLAQDCENHWMQNMSVDRELAIGDWGLAKMFSNF